MPANQSYHADGIVYRPAVENDDAQLRQLLHDNAMDSWVSMSLEREPSYFAGNNLMGESQVVLAHSDTEDAVAIGMYNCTLMPQHINGRPQQVGYLAGLRVNSNYRNRIRILRQGYNSIRPLLGEQSATLWMTSIAEENHRARRLLEAKLKGMPTYSYIGELNTLALSCQHGCDTGILQPATAADIPELIAVYNRNVFRYHFSPVLEEGWLKGLSGKQGLSLGDFYLLKDNGRIEGCVALWDQRGFKQVVAQGYRFPLNILRPGYNIWARLTGQITLPAIGHALQSIYFAFAVFPQKSERAIAMLQDALNKAQAKGAHAAVLGLSAENPLYLTLSRRFKPSCYTTCIENVVLPGEVKPELDKRPVQPDAALL